MTDLLIRWYWRWFNISARIMGAVFATCGVFFLAKAVFAPNVDGRLAGAFAGVLWAAMGAVVLITPTYRPDLGRLQSVRRNWLTGDPRQ